MSARKIMKAILILLITVSFCLTAPEEDFKHSYEDSKERVTRMSRIRCKADSEVILNSEDTDRCASESEDREMDLPQKEEARKTTTIIRSTAKIKVLPRGPFFDFLIHICDALLNHFKIHRIRKYFNILGKALDGLGSGFLMKMKIDKFRKFVKKKSDYAGKILRQYVTNFVHAIASGKPRINEFFFAMNSIFSIYDDNRMDDYIYELKKYGRGEIKTIGDKTRWMFKDFIFGKYYKAKYEVSRDIKLKLKLAIIEYERRHKNNR